MEADKRCKECGAELHTDWEYCPYCGVYASVNILYLVRRRRGLTLKKAAEGMGVTVSAVSKWERGDIAPIAKHIETLAAYYGIPAERIEKEVQR